MIALGIVPDVVRFLGPLPVSGVAASPAAGAVSPELQFEAAWVLTNIASGTSKHTKLVVACGAIPPLVQLLSSPTLEVRDQAVWTLGNIAGDSAACRDAVLKSGAFQQLLRLAAPYLGTGSLSGTTRGTASGTALVALRNIVWAISNLCRGKPAPDFRIVGEALPVLAALLSDDRQDEELGRCLL